MARRRGGKPTFEYGKWRIRWLDYSGVRRSAVFETEDDAVNELRRRELEAEDVRRGLRAPLRAPDKTLGDVFDYWLKHRAPQKRTAYDDQSIIRTHLRPAFGHVRLRDLSAAHIDAFIEQRAHLSHKTVGNLLTLLISSLNVAKNDLRWVPELPRIRKPKRRGMRDSFTYLETDQCIARFLSAARREGDHVHAFYATAVFTGLRAGELAALRWRDVDLERRLIVVQRSFDGPTKSGLARYVPILDPTLALLKAWRLQCPGDLVFPNKLRKMHVESARIFKGIFKRTLSRAGFSERLVAVQRRDLNSGALVEVISRRPHIRFHDLRHTFASHWVMKGGDIFKLQKILGHSTIQMTMRYAHLAPHAFASDYDRFGSRTPETQIENVFPLAREDVSR